MKLLNYIDAEEGELYANYQATSSIKDFKKQRKTVSCAKVYFLKDFSSNTKLSNLVTNSQQ